MALKIHFGYRIWQEWPDDIRLREPDAVKRYRNLLQNDIAFWSFLQFEFFRQWDKLKATLHRKGIQLIGDLPIYVSMDAAEPWSAPGCFQMDENGRPTAVAGVPPDYFSKTGQLWGNPLYNWEALKADGSRFWVERLRQAGRMYDVIRIDHFRGFYQYYAVPAGHSTAEHGKWKKGPGIDFFKTVQSALPDLRLIAEDLGVQSPGLSRLLRQTEYPGMKVLQFAFDGGGHNPYLPHNHTQDCVVYTGTHDNNTTVGFFDSAKKRVWEKAAAYLNLPPNSSPEALAGGMIAAAYASVANTAIVPLQDFLSQDGKSRINTPGTVGTNWRYRLTVGELTDDLAKQINMMVKRYGREK